MNHCKCGGNSPEWKDYGSEPLVINLEQSAKNNPNFRTTIWTGKYLQTTLMSIPVGGEVGLELHPQTDQWFLVESGCALAMMGKCRDSLSFRRRAERGSAIFIPAGSWHNILNIGCTPLKLCSLYAPPQHPAGTIHESKQDSDAAEA